MAIYRGISGVNREVKRQFRRIGGVNREINKQYRGIGGTNRLVFNCTSPIKFRYLTKYVGTGGYCNFINGGVGVALYTGSTAVTSGSAPNSNLNEFHFVPETIMTGTFVVNFGSSQTGWASVVAYDSSGAAVFINGGFASPNTTRTYNITTPFARLVYATDLADRYTTINSATFNNQPAVFSL